MKNILTHWVFAFIRRVLFALGSVAWLVFTNAYAASFDCKKAKTETEKAVCDSVTLSKLDEELAKTYRETFSKTRKSNDKRELQKEQREWPDMRDARCYTDEACLANEYADRIEALKKLVADQTLVQQIAADGKREFSIKQVARHQKLIEVVNQFFPANDPRFGGDNIGQSCAALLDDLRADRNVTVINPVAESDDANDPAFAKYQNSNCNGTPNQTFIDTYQTLASIGEFGYRLYRLPGQEIIYADMKQAQHWGPYTQKSGGFSVVDFNQCKTRKGMALPTTPPGKHSVSIIIKHGARYYAIAIESMELEGSVGFDSAIIDRNKWPYFCGFGTFTKHGQSTKPIERKK